MSLCCINCFSDSYLREHIKEEGTPGTCYFCKKKSRYCVEAGVLEYLFSPLVGLYTPIEDFMPTHDLKERDGEFLWDKIDEDWCVFSDVGCNNREEILRAIFSDWESEEPSRFLESYVEREGEYWGDEREASDKLKKEWKILCEEIMKDNRFFPKKKKLDLRLLGDLLSFVTHQTTKPKNTYYRARISKDGNVIPSSRMGKPPPEKTPDGRVNPKGIPYLYLASDIDTAIAEIRPGVNDKVTVARFRVESNLNIIDLRNPWIRTPFELGENLQLAVTYFAFLRMLGTELSRPVDPRSSGVEYVPLQFLCEFIKNKGYEGVLYKSAIAGGYNLALFSSRKVKCTRTGLHNVEEIQYKHKKCKQ